MIITVKSLQWVLLKSHVNDCLMPSADPIISASECILKCLWFKSSSLNVQYLDNAKLLTPELQNQAKPLIAVFHQDLQDLKLLE